MSSVLNNTVDDDTLPPSQDCIDWICDNNLKWKLLEIYQRKFWTYSSKHEIDSWKQCFQNSFSPEYTIIKQGVFHVVKA